MDISNLTLIELLRHHIRCAGCKYWKGEKEKIPSDGRYFASCEHPRMNIEHKDPVIEYGADDDYGSFFQTSWEFGCTYYKEKKETAPRQAEVSQ